MKSPHTRFVSIVLGAVLATVAGAIALPAQAAGDDSTPASQKSTDPDYLAGKKAIDAGNWKLAIESFTRAAERDKDNADIQNYLGYAYRKSGNLDTAFKYYTVALKLAPDHRGVREYIGEAYLMKGDLKMAKEQLAALDRICTFGCEEYRELKKAVAEYEQKQKQH